MASRTRGTSRIATMSGVPKEHHTWATYWSAWQYLFTPQTEKRPIGLLDGQADQKGIGLFARFGYADKDTNPVEWAVSGGLASIVGLGSLDTATTRASRSASR